MQREDRYPEAYDPEPRSRPGSRRNSASLSRRSSFTKDRERQTSPDSCLSRRGSITGVRERNRSPDSSFSRRNSVIGVKERKNSLTPESSSRRNSTIGIKDRKSSPESGYSRRSSVSGVKDRQKPFPAESSSSRRGSVVKPNDGGHPRRNSVSKDRDSKKKSPLNTAPSSTHSTPKKSAKIQLDFIVTGKQLLKRSDRANSLPGYHHRRPSLESPKKKPSEPKRVPLHNTSQSSRSRETSLEDDMSLDLSQVSDFEDTNSKYGIQKTLSPLATSTPKSHPQKATLLKSRSTSLHSQIQSQKMEASKVTQKEKRSNSTFSCSRDSLYKTNSSASNYKYPPSTELDYSSVSPEYSGLSSADMSPRRTLARDEVSPRSQELQVSSCCVSTWQDISESRTAVGPEGGEWNSFWANYNNSLATVPVQSYYDQCPTPYRTENIDFADLDVSDSSRKRSPEHLKNINYIIRNEGLHLTPRETQNMIKCAHILGNVLSKAIDRRSKERKDEIYDEKVQDLDETEEEKDPEVELKKKNLTLNLKETAIPLDTKEEKKHETVTTQTDISLPNTKSAPKIFEKILRQLSKSTLEESFEKKLEIKIEKDENKEECKDVKKNE